uniref:Small nuclear ribonucleoprotein polypeptide A' n=1 Tax=Gasterosteus aculeatus aculeatus TaxID=481459 RepID=A0AAQ4PIU1_GASAC
MVKLSAELIEQAAQYTNPVRDRELDLRAYKIPVLENLGATLDQFDAIDFSDNEIRKLDGFPLLRRLKTLLMNNNRICRIGENLEHSLSALTELVLTNNNIQELGDLDPLATVKTLTLLSLLRNPVTNKKHYRLYVINKMPQIRVLDFQKVKLKLHAGGGSTAGEEEDGPVTSRCRSDQGWSCVFTAALESLGM